MRFPSKVTPYRESIMAQFPAILQLLESEDLRPSEIYSKMKSKLNGPEDLVEILDCLYVLGAIELDEDMGVVHYVKRNKM